MGSVAAVEWVARMSELSRVRPIGNSAYQVEIEGRTETVYIAGAPGARWAWLNGRVYREAAESTTAKRSRGSAALTVFAPMPATVVKVVATPGARVSAGDTLVVIEAMKMEWPLKAEGEATVKAVHCKAGDLVQTDTVLVELS